MRLILGCVLCINYLTQPAISAPSDIDHFEYHPERIEVGTLYLYIKSNHDGTKPARVWVYVATREHLEVLKWEENGTDFAFVTADMDWDIFSPNHLSSWVLMNSGRLRWQAHMSLDTATDVITAWVPSSEGDTTTVRHYPVHVYNFDFISFNYIFRHLKDPEKPFEIGIVEPTWDLSKGIFQYQGKVSVEYQRNEKRNGAECRVYRVGGPGMNNEFGTIWVDEAKGHFVDVVHAWRDNPDWNNFKFELQSIDVLTLPEWHIFIETQRETMRQRAKERAEKKRTGRK